MATKKKAKGGTLADVVYAGPAARTSTAQERKWRAEDALSTLTRAEEHRADKGLMRDVRRLAAKRKASLDRVSKR